MAVLRDFNPVPRRHAAPQKASKPGYARARESKQNGARPNRWIAGMFAATASVFILFGSGMSWADTAPQSEQSGAQSGDRVVSKLQKSAPRAQVAAAAVEVPEPEPEDQGQNLDAEVGAEPAKRGGAAESDAAPASEPVKKVADSDQDSAAEQDGENTQEGEENQKDEEELSSEEQAQSGADQERETEDEDDPLETPQSGTEEAPASKPKMQTFATPMPMAIPAPPYLKWSVKDAAGNLVGGATIRVQGPRGTQNTDSNAYSGVASFTVTDCVAEPCSASGGDQDPTPGVFVVNKIGSATNDHQVRADRRYRVQQVTAPEGYKFTNSSNPWVQIPGSGQNPSNNAWQNSVYTFADFAVTTLTPVCEPGNIYGISSGGQIQHIAPNGTKTNLGNTPTGTVEFNGLGIGMGGTKVYAYSRSDNASNASVWEYSTTTGNWTAKNRSTGTQAVQFVAGAVSYDGEYYMGGYNSAGTEFHIWEYNPTANSISKKGWIDTSSGSGGATNGDMAFDSAGNLYVVRGSGTTTTIFSATYADFTGTTGQIPASVARSQPNTVNNVNGVAFDSNAKIYLGQASDITWYQMPDWTPSGNFTSSLSDSTDLASCDTPPSITIQKNVLGRVNSTDQFRMQLRQGTTGSWNDPLGDNTTTGTANGIQDEKVGPQITPRSITYSFRELFEGTGNTSANYVSSWECKAYDNAGANIDPNPAALGSGNGTSGTVTIPEPGPLSPKKQIICTFTNSPLVAHVNITKNVLDRDGQNPAPQAAWTVGAVATATSGTVSSTPASTTQQTNASGQANWKLTYNSSSAAANVVVSETQKPGHKFISASCTVTDINGSTGTPITFSSEAGGTIPAVKPGETVDCVFTNQELENTLQLVKVVENQWGGDKAAGDFPLAVTPKNPSGPAKTFVHNVAQRIDPGTYTISETQQPGYELVSISCVQDGGQPVTLTDGEITVAAGDLVTVCTLTNRDQPGDLAWAKVASGTTDLLAGSEWKLIGPAGSGSTELPITDCVANSAADCAGPDVDPAAGKFKIEDLAWGTYSLVETKAPAGYILNETGIPVVISGAALSVDLGNVENEQHDGPGLPITGGLGKDAFIMGGGILALLGAVVGTSIFARRSLKRIQ